MKKNGFTIIEICVVFLIILGALFLFIPKGIESTKQIKLISKWAQKYSDIQYMFVVIKTQIEMSGKTPTNQLKEDIMRNHLRIVKPLDKVYKPLLKNGKKLDKQYLYSVPNYYLNNNDEIIGFKLTNKNCDNKNLCAIMTFDLNGIDLPNIYGKDIFGIKIYKNRVEAFGTDTQSTQELKNNCQKTGLDCSYYYLIGGHFEE